MGSVDLKDMSLDEMRRWVAQLGQPAYRGQQIFRWIYEGVDDIDAMSDLPSAFRQKLKESCFIGRLSIYKKQISMDGDTTKYLFLLKDGNIIESVLMRYKYGNTACVSSQVGCRMGCSFCASTMNGVKRDLSKGEMIDQILQMQLDIGQRISHMVLMGSGEPLDNYQQSVAFMRLLHEPQGLNMSFRNMTLSTCGIVPRIYDLAQEHIPVTLAVSLHAPSDDLRQQLMPIARVYSVAEIIEACRYYASVTGRRVTFEYIMLKDLNDKPEHARMLADILEDMLCHVNLISFNEVEGRSFAASDDVSIERFYNILTARNIPASIRRRLGADIDAACGQLRRRVLNK